MVQMAWAFINDSYSTTLCLEWEPEIIAIALMYLANKASQYTIETSIENKENNGTNWWDQFVEGLSIESIEDICHQILDLYSIRNYEQEIQAINAKMQQQQQQ